MGKIKECIKMALPEKIQFYIYYRKMNKENNRLANEIEIQLKLPRTIYLLGTPTFENMGDHAIAIAEKKCIEAHAQDFNIIEIPLVDLAEFLPVMDRFVNENDVICFQGGGNMGTEYYIPELFRRILIKKYPQNKMIIFPQTIDYSRNGILDRISFFRAKRIYRKNSNLYVFARETYSYEIMKKNFKKIHVRLIPDIVLSLSVSEDLKERTKISLCLRNDKERALQSEAVEKFMKSISLRGEEVCITDTVTEQEVSLEDRERELQRILGIFCESKLVVTDRIHGMIFAALTKTPCIVIGNYNHKVRGEYEMIHPYFDYLYYLENVEEFGEKMDDILKKGFKYTEHSMELRQEFEKINTLFS